MNIKLKIKKNKDRSIKKFLFLFSVIVISVIIFLKSIGIIIFVNHYNTQLFFIFNNQNFDGMAKIFFLITSLVDFLMVFVYMIFLYRYFPSKVVLFFFGFCCAMLTTYILKVYYDAPRPIAVFGLESIMHLGEISYHHSFPSGHATSSMALASFLMYISKKPYSFLFLVLGILGSLSRVIIGKHFPIDVLVGSCIGFFIVRIPLLLEKNFSILIHRLLKQKISQHVKNILFYAIYIFGILYIPFLYFYILAEKYKGMHYPIFFFLLTFWIVCGINIIRKIQKQIKINSSREV